VTIRRISTGPGLPAGFPFSLGAEENGILYISGMPAIGSEGTFTAGTFEEEADRAWANIVAVAAAGGYSPDDFLYVQVLLGDIDNYGAINEWWRRQFPDPAGAPARAGHAHASPNRFRPRATRASLGTKFRRWYWSMCSRTGN
jgi:2-iminobutanoate/2-iminopropanoate deaminase